MKLENIIRFYTVADHSDNFIIYHYPDGQKNIRLNLDKLDNKKLVDINCSIRNWCELEILCCLVAALYKHDFRINEIKFFYLFGIRCDRQFQPGEPNYFRDVLAPVLNKLTENTVSDIELLWPFPPLPILKQDLDRAFTREMIVEIDKIKDNKKFNFFIYGDETASSYEYFDVDTPFFIKNREGNKINAELKKEDIASLRERLDASGKLNILILDDLCDGGATFIAEGKYLKNLFPEAKLSLLVYHGLFTSGLDCLLEYFDEIICTNSYQKIDHPRVKQIEVI